MLNDPKYEISNVTNSENTSTINDLVNTKHFDFTSNIIYLIISLRSYRCKALHLVSSRKTSDNPEKVIMSRRQYYNV